MVYRVSKLKNMSNCEILVKVQFHNATHTNTPKTGPGFLKISTLLKKSVNLGVPLPWICYGFAPFCEIRKVCCCARQNFLPHPEYSDAITFSAVSAYLNFCKSQGKLETGWLCGMRMRMECHLVPPRTLNWSR